MASIITGMTTAQIAALTTNQIVSLATSDMLAFSSDQIAALTTAQVAAMETANIAALSTSQVAAMETADIAALTTAQIVGLTTAQVAALTTNQVVALTTAQVAALETADVAALRTAQVAAMETADVAALTTAQVAGMTTAQVAGMTTAQVAALTTAQVVALTTAQVAGMETRDIVALTTAQVAAMETADVAALRTNQVAAITTSGIQALSTAQVVALTTAEVVALTTRQIVALTTTQVAALTTTQVESLTTNQVAAFTTDQISHLTLGTPLILDLNGDGKLSQSISEGVKFDLFATGNKVNTGWVSSSDGLLVMDRNLDGSINDGSELFGSSTRLADGSTAANGYVALSALDSDGDGAITAADQDWSKLSVWTDVNSDGASQAEELHGLESLGITRLNLGAESVVEKDAGNLVGLVSSYDTADGTTHEMADVWFVADKQAAQSRASIPSADNAAGQGPGASMADIVQSIASFYEGAQASPTARGTPLPAITQPNGVAANLAGIVSVMQQFDDNGNAIGTSPFNQAVSSTPTLTTSPGLDPLTQGILATPK